METRKFKDGFFTKKEVLDFTKLCQVHGFKNRHIVRDEETGRVKELNVFLPEVYGGDEKMLGNISRYTNSRRSQTPFVASKNKLVIKVTYKKK